MKHLYMLIKFLAIAAGCCFSSGTTYKLEKHIPLFLLPSGETGKAS